jgi:lipopolysaccharide/colanic/teichoic acid biosynthesis glycosyltransferase
VAILLIIASVTRIIASPGPLFVLIAVVFATLFIQREAVNVLFGPQRTCDWRFSSPMSSFGIREIGAWSVVHVEASSSQTLKRLVDMLGAVFLIVAILPLGLAVAALIKLDSDGPVFVRQRRIGKGGAPFSMWKFRSMHADVNRYARSPVHDSDPRITRLGRGLRRMSIDELPQLLNVLKGDMSLVGPRPEMPFVVKEYTARERLRLNAIPGITGLWQISPARAMPIHENLEFDLFYIEQRSFFLDVAIMLRTLTAIVRGIGAW